MTGTIIGVITATAAFLSAYLLVVYFLVIRPWHTRWGATDAEAKEPLPGDNLVPHPRLKTTRAVTINARGLDVWPWLVQMGQGRGGFYSYTWIENLFRLDIKNADRVIPELQDLKVGDIIPIEPGGLGLSVISIEPGHSLVLHNVVDMSTGRTLRQDEEIPDNYFDSSWTFVLKEDGEKTTRLIARLRLDWSPGLMNMIGYRIFFEPAHFIMERKMLLGIKKRAEARSLSSDTHISR